VLQWFGRPVVVDLGRTAPSTLHEEALEADPAAGPAQMAVPLPVYPIARYAPGLRGLRVWARAAEITTLALGVMAALTLTLLLGRLPRSGRIAGGLVALALVLMDAHMSPHALVEPKPRPVDAWLAAQPGSFRVVELPWEAGVSGTQLWFSSFNGKGVALAQASVLPPAVAEAYAPLRTFPQGGAWPEVLRRWRVRYLLVDDGAAIPDLGAAMARSGLRPVTRQGTVEVFEVAPERSTLSQGPRCPAPCSPDRPHDAGHH
jgi:hypothetical protein